MDREINELSQEVRSLKHNTALSYEVEEYVNRLQSEVQSDLDRLKEPNAFRDFLLQYVDEQYRDYRDDEKARQEPLCTCPSPSCDLKDGRIPATLNLSNSLSQGFVRFRQEHRGQPIVLDEARDAWRQKKKRIKDNLRHMILVMHRGSLPEEEQERLAKERGDKHATA